MSHRSREFKHWLLPVPNMCVELNPFNMFLIISVFDVKLWTILIHLKLVSVFLFKKRHFWRTISIHIAHFCPRELSYVSAMCIFYVYPKNIGFSSLVFYN